MNAVRKVIDTIVSWLCIGILALMTVLVTYQVIVRYFFNNPSATSEVLSRYLFVWLIFLCAAYVFGLREHMNIPFIKDKLPRKLRVACEVLIELIIAAFGTGIMALGGWLGAMGQMTQLDSALQIPMGAIYLAVPISGVLILFYSITNVVTIIKKRNEAPPQTDDASNSSV